MVLTREGPFDQILILGVNNHSNLTQVYSKKLPKRHNLSCFHKRPQLCRILGGKMLFTPQQHTDLH